MIDVNKHRLYLVQILKDIYSDDKLAGCLGFKGGSALMFFYDLPRFSVDLDFNLICTDDKQIISGKIRKILLKYGRIHDEAAKLNTLLFVLDYRTGERKLKVEISTRNFEDRYEIRDLLGLSMLVMNISDMFSHKLCALLERNILAGRDIFDCWFLMKRQTPVNPIIIKKRGNMPLEDFLGKCIERIENVKNSIILQGIGELIDEQIKNFVRKGLKEETISLLKFYRDYPITE
ncbi:MAG: nucleotidyl transferase AbiEii/AbiGii toxin family protein [Bacteroidales bacterium]